MLKLIIKIKRIGHLVLAWVSYWVYGRPARKLIVIGVTGTKGKSTTCRLIASALEAGGSKVGLLSTVEYQIGEKHLVNKKQMSMLGRGEIQKFLKEMVLAGCKYAVIETSSEGILQYRHYGLLYDVAVFTNLGTEHQERHDGFENLKKDKGKLFASLSYKKIIGGKAVPKVIVANGDDANSEYYLNFKADEKWKFGLGINPGGKSLAGKLISSSETGCVFGVGEKQFALNIVGEFNMPNALAAIAVARSQGESESDIEKGLASVKGIPGRMEFIKQGQPFLVVVDYAHEVLSLTALFSTLRSFIKGNGKLIGIIGSDGGGRDTQKRFKMGEVAGALCDIVIVTDVNPWDEDPKKIAEMLAVGARKKGKIDDRDLFIIIDRRTAIEKACELAGEGGAVAITAKGTESSLIVAGGVRIPWDDRKVASEALAKKYFDSVV